MPAWVSPCIQARSTSSASSGGLPSCSRILISWCRRLTAGLVVAPPFGCAQRVLVGLDHRLTDGGLEPTLRSAARHGGARGERADEVAGPAERPARGHRLDAAAALLHQRLAD